MVFSFLYLAVRALIGALVRSRRGLHVKDVELLVLRHELEIICRARRGVCFWSLRGHFCAGIKRSFAGSGVTRAASVDGRSCRLRLGNWSCGSPGRIRAGVTGGSVVSWPARLAGVADEHPPAACPREA
jgi:hypothetical protein